MAEQKTEKQPQGRRLELRRVLLDMAPPKTAHSFGWARVGDQFLLEVGYFDVAVIAEILKDTQQSSEAPMPLPVDWFVSDRFVMNQDSAQRFVEVAENFRDELLRFQKDQKTAHAK